MEKKNERFFFFLLNKQKSEKKNHISLCYVYHTSVCKRKKNTILYIFYTHLYSIICACVCLCVSMTCRILYSVVHTDEKAVVTIGLLAKTTIARFTGIGRVLSEQNVFETFVTGE